jgi:hypothetical protein
VQDATGVTHYIKIGAWPVSTLDTSVAAYANRGSKFMIKFGKFALMNVGNNQISSITV